ncbi:MAG: hypothetical protein OJF47_002408 [Nitrospira sp.]|jgi:hypothetical protein|nr:MAG: hypothetical protein OJF47_002408 [Nitrospira sp.]
MSSLVEAVKTVIPTLTGTDSRVFQALLFSPHQAASAGQLRKILGLSAVVQVNNSMGRIGRKVRESFGAHPDGLGPDEYEWWHVIATGTHTADRGFVWQLRNEVVDALVASGYSTSGEASANEVGDSEPLFEGAVREVRVNAYERNPVARERCIEVHGAICAACGFDFGAIYGEIAAGFIHVHHIKPLSEVGAEYEVDPVEDLRPVCPNCHAVIHLTNPPRTVEEVRSLLQKRKMPNNTMNQFAITNVSVYKAIAISAHLKMHELTNAGRRLKDGGSPGWIITFDHEQRSFKQAMIAIVFTGMWLEAFLHLRIVRDHGLKKFKEYDFKSLADKLQLLGCSEPAIIEAAQKFQKCRKELVHEKAYCDAGQITKAQDGADNANQLLLAIDEWFKS